MRVRCRNTPHKSRTIFYNSPIWKIYTKLCNNNSPTCLPPSNCYFGNHPRQWLLPHHCDWKRESFVTISDTFRFQHPSCSPLLRNWTLPSSVPSNGMSYSYCLIIKRGRKGTLERKQPTQFSTSWKPPLAPFPKSSNGGLTIWLSYGFVLSSPFCHIAVSKGASATISTPTQSCVETDYQSVIHHSRPYRGRLKGTSQQLRYSFPYPKTTIFVHFFVHF